MASTPLDTPFGSIVDPLVERAERDPGGAMLLAGGGTVTNAALLAEVERVSGGLGGLGIRPGESVAIMLGNDPDFIAVWMGIAVLGAVEVPVNTAFHGDSLRHVLRQADCVAIIVEQELLPAVREVQPSLPLLRRVIVRGAGGAGLPVLSEIDGRCRRAPSDGGSPAAILFTSGTTGRSKGALVPHRYFLLMAAANARAMRLAADDVYYTCLPLFHGMAQLSGTMGPMVAGASIAIAPKFSVSRFWEDCAAYGITGFGAVSTMVSLLLKSWPDGHAGAESVRFGFALGVSPHVHGEFERTFDVRLINGFGMTESGQVTYTDYDGESTGSAGAVIEDLYEVQIQDDAGAEVVDGERGEIVIRPRTWGAMMRGYYGMPEETLAAMRDYWFRTGDSGYFRGGELHFADRLKDSIRRRGENISSYEVESAILGMESVLEVAAFPVSAEFDEDEVMVAVVPKAGRRLEAREVIDHCLVTLPRFAVPKYVRLMAELPKTPTSKVAKHVLKSAGVTSDTAEF